MKTQSLKNFLTQPLHQYDKTKVNLLKSILPIIIIIHHISNKGISGIERIGALGDIAMFIFFAMSGFGLVTSYLKNNNYINGFLRRSLTKLFIPYLIALIVFVIYRHFEGIDQIALFKEKGLFSFVPTSWYIWTLSYFYIFFFIVFRFCRSNMLVKTTLTCLLVICYVLVAPHIGIESWRYSRCPAFCIGIIFALFDTKIRTKFVRWHILIVLIFLIAFRYQPHGHRFDVYIYPTALFLFMYTIGQFKENKIIKFISSISLEIFIIQFIPIYIIINDLQLTSSIIVVPLVIILDIFFAYIMHLINKKITKSIIAI